MTMTTETTHTCPVCDTPSQTTVCEKEIVNAGLCLESVIKLAPEVETTVCRQSRYAVRAGRPAMNIKYENEPKPTGGLRPTQLPVNLQAAEQSSAAFQLVQAWADQLSLEHGAEIPDVRLGELQVVVAARFVSYFLKKMANHPQALRFVEEMRVASFMLHTVVDAPEQLQIAGSCECGEYLYAPIGATTVTCRFKSCGNAYDVVQARRGLIETLRNYQVTAAQGATLICYIDSRRDRFRSRKNIIQWGMREKIWSGYDDSGDNVYLFGEIADKVFSELAWNESK